MKIEKIHIENFGKLSNITFDLKEGLNEIYKNNGFGKTTLSIFIKVMFYGMPASRENMKMERKKYMPWQGGDFGGFIEYQTAKGRFRLTRFFGRTPESDTFELLDLASNSLLEKPKTELGEEIFGLGKETFEMTAFFPQNNFESSTTNEISANVLGLDKLKFDLANVSLALDKIKKKEGEIKKLKPNKEQLSNKKNLLIELNSQLLNLQNNLDMIDKEILNLKSLKNQKQNEFINIEKQNKIQEESLKIKESIEKEILNLSGDINKLYLEQENLNKKRQDLANDMPLNMKFSKNLLLLIGVVIFLTPLLLGIFGIINIFIGLSICVVALVGTSISYYILNKKTKRHNTYNDQNQNINNQLQEINREIAQKREAVKNAEIRLENYKNLSKVDVLYFQSKTELSELNLEIERKELYKESCQKDLDRLLDSIDNLKTEINNFEFLEKDTAKKLAILSQTKEFLSQAHQNVSMRFVEPVNNAMDEIINNFQLNGRRFVVDTNFDIKEITYKGTKEINYSSQGIKDILMFCMRVYFISEIYKKEKPFIILDDTFVNLDDDNMNKVSQIINILAKDFQIIYSYCHKRCKIKNS